LGIALSVFLSCYSCNSSDDEDLIGNWVQLGSFSGVKRADAVAVSMDNKAYIATGYDGEDRLNDVWEYDASRDTWIRLDEGATVRPPARNDAVGFGANGKIYIATGYDGTYELDDLWEFDPASGVWTQKADFPGGVRRGAVAFSINNKGYVGTGLSNKNYMKDFWEYDPTTDTWTKKADISGPKRRDAAAFVLDGKGYVVSGTDNGQQKEEFSYYDPSTDTWTPLRKISNATDETFDDDYDITRDRAVAFAVGGKGYLATGGRNTTGSTVWEYNPATDLWIEKTSYEGSSRIEAVAFVVNDVAFVATGRSSSYYFDDVWRFEPTSEYEDQD